MGKTMNTILRTVLKNYIYKEYVNGLDLEENEAIFELGCKKDFLSKQIIKRLKEEGLLVCADISDDSFNSLNKFIEKHQNVKGIFGDIRKVHFNDSEYDRVIIHNAFFDISKGDRLSYVEYLLSVMKSDGRLHIIENIKEDEASSTEIRGIMRKAEFEEKNYVFKKSKGAVFYIGEYQKKVV